MLRVSYNQGSKSFEVSQEHYSSDGQQNTNSIWSIPINFATEKNPDFENTDTPHLLVGKTSQIGAPQDFDSNDWYIFNKQQIGYYRVNYNTENWRKLSNTLNSKKLYQIHVSNRAQLIDDAINFGMSGHLDVDLVFELVTYLRRENHFLPFAAASEYLDKFGVILEQNDPTKFMAFEVNK